MKSLICFCCLFAHLAVFSQANNIGQFAMAKDIGNPKNAGSSVYDATTKTYTLTGSGYNIWFDRDEFHYLYNQMQGDFVLTADFEFVNDTGNAHRKMGWMVRETDHESAVSVNAVQHADGLVVLQWRRQQGENMRDPEDEIFFATNKVFKTMQLERKGNKFTMRIGDNASQLELVGTHELKMPKTVLAGLYVCSHNENAVDVIKVSNVRIKK